MLCIMYFNLNKGVHEEQFLKNAKEFINYLEGKVEGFGASKLYKHHVVGANPRRFQLHMEMKDFATWDRWLAFIQKDPKGTRLYREWQNLVNMNTHYDEFVNEIPL